MKYQVSLLGQKGEMEITESSSDGFLCFEMHFSAKLKKRVGPLAKLPSELTYNISSRLPERVLSAVISGADFEPSFYEGFRYSEGSGGRKSEWIFKDGHLQEERSGEKISRSLDGWVIDPLTLSVRLAELAPENREIAIFVGKKCRSAALSTNGDQVTLEIEGRKGILDLDEFGIRALSCTLFPLISLKMERC